MKDWTEAKQNATDGNPKVRLNQEEYTLIKDYRESKTEILNTCAELGLPTDGSVSHFWLKGEKFSAFIKND